MFLTNQGHVSNQVTCNKKDKNKSGVSLSLTIFFVACNFNFMVKFLMNTHDSCFCGVNFLVSHPTQTEQPNLD